MEWYHDLYVGDSIKDQSEKIKRKILHRAGQIQIYVISLASNPSNLLDIIPARELLQKYYAKRQIYIIGLAKGREEACRLACSIVTEIYEKTGAFFVRDYIMAQEAESRGRE